MSNLDPKVSVQEMAGANDSKNSKLASAWHWYKKMTILPSGMGKYQSSGKLAYILMTVVALVMVILITMDDSVYTDVNELPHYHHVLPDVVMCPYPTSEHLRTETTDITNTSVRDPYNRKFFVWYLRQEVEALEMTDCQLDALAARVRDNTIASKEILSQLNEKAEKMMEVLLEHPEWKQSQIVGNYIKSANATNKISALWLFLAVPPAIDKVNVKQLKCWPNQEGTVDYDWCKRVAEPVWIGNHYCVLFPFQQYNVSMWSHHWNIKHYMFNWTAPVPKIYSEGLGVKEWIGNFELQKLNYDDMWTTFPREDDCYAYVDYDAIKISNALKPIQTICQENMVFIKGSRFEQCESRQISVYWMFKVGLNWGCDLSAWFYPQKITHTTVRESLTTVQRIQLYGGVLGFTTGFSILQLFELFTKTIGRRMKKSTIRVSELVIMIVMTAVSCWLAIGNLHWLVSNSRYVRSYEYNLLSTQPIVPHLVLSRPNLNPFYLLNHSRLAEYNVSLEMLRYLTAQSGLTVYNSYFYIPFFLDHPKNQNMSKKTIAKLKRLASMNKNIDAAFFINSSHVEVQGLFTSTMDNQFEALAAKLNLIKSVPPHQVYETFRVDLCQVIKLCVYQQLVIIENCCEYAHYETFQAHRWSDAITLRFPKQYQLNTAGDKNGIDVYFDTKVFSEANYVYLGPDHLSFVREIDFSTAGLRFSSLRFYVYNGSELEQHNYGQTIIDLTLFESADKIQNAGFAISRIVRLQANEENDCRSENIQCKALSINNLATSSLARALAEKTMCKCHVCHSTAPNPLIAALWKENGCCSASDASKCFSQPMKCCQNGIECCFEAVKNWNQTCTETGTMVQTLLYNRQAESQAKCSIEYEVTSPLAAASGSVVAQKLNENDKQMFQEYYTECKKTLCNRKTIEARRLDVVINDNQNTKDYFCLRTYIIMDHVLTSVEDDRFSILEATIQFVGGFGLLFGLSLMTVFEMVSAVFSGIKAKITGETGNEEDDPDQTSSICKKIVFDRALRSVDVFAQFEKMSRKITDAGQQNNAKKPARKPDGIDETSVLSDVQSTICLITGTLLAGYCVYMLAQTFTTNNTLANYEVSFNGEISPPSLAFCVPTEDLAAIQMLTTSAECVHQNQTAESCQNTFDILLHNENKSCLVNDLTSKTRMHGVDKKRFKDLEIRFLKSSSNLTQLGIWFGYLPTVHNSQLTPLEPWIISKSTTVKYKLLKSISSSNCDTNNHTRDCPICNQQRNTVCCLKEAKKIPDILRHQDPLPACKTNFFTVELMENKQQDKDWIVLKLIDYYGVVEVRKVSKRHTWSFVLSNLGTVIDTFVGVTFLNVLCAVIMLVMLGTSTAYGHIKAVLD